MIWVRLLYLLLFLGVVQSSSRTCAQCVAGEFLSVRSLMQDSSVGMSMGWIEEWTNTNCITGTVNMITCKHACVKITVAKSDEEKNSVHGIMMDCSDNMIHASPDLPREIDFKAYDENATFSSKRRNFNITYTFTMTGFDSFETLREEHASIVLPYFQEGYKTGTIIIYVGFILLSIILCCAVCICSICSNLCKRSSPKYAVQYAKNDEDSEGRVAVVNTSNEVEAVTSYPSAPSDELQNRQEEKNGVVDCV